MVPGATNQQPQASQLPPISSSSSTVPPATTEEDGFLKSNTDCVYFLASPLTCLKGSDCEYRHSDIARVNPRDCWYWLNGNCLNPKCGFRHPPLDGLFGAEVPSVPQAPVVPVPNATPYGMSKQGVVCIFFQKGFCLKGHLCPFLHGPPNVVNNKPVPPNPVSQPSKTTSTDLEKSVQDQKFRKQETVPKPAEFLPSQGKQPTIVQAHPTVRNGAMEKKIVPPPEEGQRYRPASVDFVEIPDSRSKSNHGYYEAQNVSDNEGNLTGKDIDEYSREPTPGFDVLVDDELGESEYYPNEEQLIRSRGHDYDLGHDVDRHMYNEQLDFDRYNGEEYRWEDHRESSNFGRSRHPINDSPDQFDFDQSDLRHRILKQRRGNVGGLRSVISREHPRDSYPDRIPRRSSHEHHLDPSSLSSRLRGRIKIPERNGNGNGSRAERKIHMGRHQRSRYSPGRPLSSNHRIKGSEFSGPKRLSDLKRKHSQQSENVTFEGPKPLSEILKRKRLGSVLSSGNDEDSKSKEVKGNNEKERNEELKTEVAEKEIVENNKVGSIDEDAMLDEELEAYDHKDGDYDYEQIDGEEYNLGEGDEDFVEEEGDGKKESPIKCILSPM